MGCISTDVSLCVTPDECLSVSAYICLCVCVMCVFELVCVCENLSGCSSTVQQYPEDYISRSKNKA